MMKARFLVEIEWSKKSGWNEKELGLEIGTTLNAHLFSVTPENEYKIVVRKAEGK
jgi:hypothetical protein